MLAGFAVSWPGRLHFGYRVFTPVHHKESNDQIAQATVPGEADINLR